MSLQHKIGITFVKHKGRMVERTSLKHREDGWENFRKTQGRRVEINCRGYTSFTPFWVRGAIHWAIVYME
jgi:hypothetical protein